MSIDCWIGIRRPLPTPASSFLLPPPNGSASFTPSFALSLTPPSTLSLRLPSTLSFALLMGLPPEPLLEPPPMRLFAPLYAIGANDANPAPAARPRPPERLMPPPRFLLFAATVCTVSRATRPIAVPIKSPTSFAIRTLRNLSFPKGWLPRPVFYLNMEHYGPVSVQHCIHDLRRLAERGRGRRRFVVEPEPVEIAA